MEWRALCDAVVRYNAANSHQEVMHLHVHIFAGRPLGPMLRRPAG
jgi:diadenosine tetraphosphate (Ap4A) HIT family hydrolase